MFVFIFLQLIVVINSLVVVALSHVSVLHGSSLSVAVKNFSA